MSSLIFFGCVINDAHPAATHARQLLHLNRIRRADSWLVLRTFLRPANKVEEYHNFEGWITFAFRGVIIDNVYEEQEKRIKYTGVIANCLMLDDKWSRNMTLCI